MLDITTIQAKQIDLTKALKKSHGQMTHCYLFDEFVVLNSIDIIKEVIALYMNDRENNPHIPKINRIYSQWYVMPKYQPLTKKHKKAYAQYKKFVELLYNFDAYNDTIYEWRKGIDNYNECIEFAQIVKTEIDMELGIAVEKLLNVAINATGRFIFDVKKVNFSVDSEGNLVLRDILVDLRDVLPRRNFVQRKVATQIIVE